MECFRCVQGHCEAAVSPLYVSPREGALVAAWFRGLSHPTFFFHFVFLFSVG